MSGSEREMEEEEMEIGLKDCSKEDLMKVLLEEVKKNRKERQEFREERKKEKEAQDSGLRFKEDKK